MTDVAQTSDVRTARAPYVIVRHETSRLELLRVSSESGGEALPVFSSGEAAREFLLTCAIEEGWRVRWCSAGELASLLLGPCTNVERVLIDPLATEDALLAGPVYREGFIASLIGGWGVG